MGHMQLTFMTKKSIIPHWVPLYVHEGSLIVLELNTFQKKPKSSEATRMS